MACPGLSVCALASGSRGNSVFVSGGDTSILVDAGLSGIELERRMAAREIAPDTLSAIVVTHEHTDHILSAGVLSRRYNIPVYMNELTCRAASTRLGRVQHMELFQCGRQFVIGDLTINPFSISHDAEDPAGLTLEYASERLGIATDMGIATRLVKEHLSGCSLLYLEANHDPDMLMSGPYPWHLKQRVKGRRGHLSNMDAGELLSEIRTSRLQHVILAHLSEENNTSEKALSAIHEALGSSSPAVSVACQDTPGDLIRL